MTPDQRRPAAFLDRDGVLNEDLGHVYRTCDLHWIPDAPRAVRRLNRAGYLVFVVTNQAGVARGLYAEEDVVALHRFMRTALAQWGARIDAFRYCPHHPEASVEAYRRSCRCRKPAPGMIEDLMQEFPVDAGSSFMIGDRQSDLEAARAAGLPAHRFSGGSLDAFVTLVMAG
jgi:D-glycero-D-manno-heptose 1,7-bisphosphate phosphatase